MKFKQKAIDTLKTIFPSTGHEWFLFLFFLLGYGSLAHIIALDYHIVFDNRIPWDAYFSFDNRAIVLTGGGFERHPLSNYFFDGIRALALWYSGGKMDASFRWALSVLSASVISMSMVQVFKYLRNIIALPLGWSYSIVLFFSLFSTNILLSFTPETYTYTLFLLMLFNHYAAIKIKKEQPIPATALTLATVSIGGLTITNAAKVFIPILFEKNLFKSFKNLFNALGRSVMAVGIFVLLFLNRLNFDYTKIITKTGEQYEKFSQPKVTPLWDMIASWFFGGNILFSNFITRDYKSPKGFEYKALFMDVYSSWVPYIFVAMVLGLVVWSGIKNFKNPLVKILLLSFFFDILIHCVLKFGLHTSYIYGGHFVYVYPLLIGWLVFAYRKHRTALSILSGILLLLTLYLGFNNGIRMQEFFEFLERYYRV